MGDRVRSAAVVSLAAARRAKEERQSSNVRGGIFQAWDEFRASGATVNLSRNTVESYATCARRAMRECPEFTRASLTAWQAELVKKGVARAYVNSIFRSVRAIVEHADRLSDDTRYELAVKALRSVKPLTCPPREPRAPQRDVLVRLMSSGALRNNAERALVLLLGTCGLRIGEALGLEPADFDERAGILYVTKQRMNSQRKNKKPHTVKVPRMVGDLLHWCKRHPEIIRPRGGPRDANKRYLFPWGEKYMEDFMARIRVACPLEFGKGNAWHVFRHLAASEIARQTGSVPDVMVLLGDKSHGAALGYVQSVRGVSTSECERVADKLCDVRLMQIEFGVRETVSPVVAQPTLAGGRTTTSDNRTALSGVSQTLTSGKDLRK